MDQCKLKLEVGAEEIFDAGRRMAAAYAEIRTLERKLETFKNEVKRRIANCEDTVRKCAMFINGNVDDDVAEAVGAIEGGAE